MRKKLLLILCLSILICFNGFAKDKEKFYTVFDNKKITKIDKNICNTLEKYCVSIFSVNPGLGKCSGVVINKTQEDTYILTAKHCLNTFEETYVEDNKVIASLASVDDDLAILIVEGDIKDKEVAKLASYNPIKDDKIYLISYPSLIDSYKSIGKIIRYSDDWGFAHLNCISGCSGGGLFNDKEELIGILWGGSERRVLSVFEKLEDIKRFLKILQK